MNIVTRENFKRTRESYCISLKDISDKCDLGVHTISNFENCTGKYTETVARPYNANKMISALNELVQEKIDSAFPNDRSNKYIKIAREKQIETAVDKAKVNKTVREYCKANDITLMDFCKMCGVSASTFYENNHPLMYLRTAEKICKATGWTMEQLLTGDFKTEAAKAKQVIKEGFGAKVEPTVKPENKTSVMPATRKNTEYTCKDGKYFVEYDIMVHRKEEISKTEFLKLIQEE